MPQLPNNLITDSGRKALEDSHIYMPGLEIKDLQETRRQYIEYSISHDVSEDVCT